MINGIVCVDNHWGIGKNNGLLFNLPADMKFFRETTKHNIVVMGYSTYLSLPKRPLPNRVNIVLWDKATSIDCLENCITFNTFDSLLNFIKILAKEYEVYICGGASVYKLFLPYYDRVLVTHVNAVDNEATAFFPNLEEDKSYHIEKILGSGIDNNLSYEFRVYKKYDICELSKEMSL